MQLQFAWVQVRNPGGTQPQTPCPELAIDARYTLPFWLRWWRSS
jgi:hypothetical protein